MRADGCALETNLLDHRRNELAEILCNTRVNHTYMTFSLCVINDSCFLCDCLPCPKVFV